MRVPLTFDFMAVTLATTGEGVIPETFRLKLKHAVNGKFFLAVRDMSLGLTFSEEYSELFRCFWLCTQFITILTPYSW